MVKNSSRLKKFEDNSIRQTKSDIQHNLRVVDSLYEEARDLSVISPP